MSSSKATFISRKRLSLAILSLLLLLPPSLEAAAFRVAAVSSDTAYSSLLSDVLTVLSGEVDSPQAIEAHRDREERKAQLAAEAELSSLRQSESFDRIEALSEASDEEMQEEDEPLVLEVVAPSLSDDEISFLSSGDEEAFRYIALREDLDMLIAASAREDGMMTESEVFIDGDEIHRNLYISNDDSAEFDALLSMLLGRLKGDDSVIVRIEVPSVVSISIDDEPLQLIRSTAVLPRGEHEIRFTSPVHETLTVMVDAQEGTVVAPELVDLPAGRLFVSTVPYDSDVYLQGRPLSGHLALEADLPFQVTATHEGFMPTLVQSRLPMDRLDIQLRPQWMEDEDIVKRAKDRFYTNLLSTIISFGGYVAAQSIEGIWPDAGTSPVTTLFAGFSFVELVALFDSMFDYYQAARLGI